MLHKNYFYFLLTCLGLSLYGKDYEYLKERYCDFHYLQTYGQFNIERAIKCYYVEEIATKEQFLAYAKHNLPQCYDIPLDKDLKEHLVNNMKHFFEEHIECFIRDKSNIYYEFFTTLYTKSSGNQFFNEARYYEILEGYPNYIPNHPALYHTISLPQDINYWEETIFSYQGIDLFNMGQPMGDYPNKRKETLLRNSYSCKQGGGSHLLFYYYDNETQQVYSLECPTKACQKETIIDEPEIERTNKCTAFTCNTSISRPLLLYMLSSLREEDNMNINKQLEILFYLGAITKKVFAKHFNYEGQKFQFKVNKLFVDQYNEWWKLSHYQIQKRNQEQILMLLSMEAKWDIFNIFRHNIEQTKWDFKQLQVDYPVIFEKLKAWISNVMVQDYRENKDNPEVIIPHDLSEDQIKNVLSAKGLLSMELKYYNYNFLQLEPKFIDRALLRGNLLKPYIDYYETCWGNPISQKKPFNICLQNHAYNNPRRLSSQDTVASEEEQQDSLVEGEYDHCGQIYCSGESQNVTGVIANLNEHNNNNNNYLCLSIYENNVNFDIYQSFSIKGISKDKLRRLETISRNPINSKFVNYSWDLDGEEEILTFSLINTAMNKIPVVQTESSFIRYTGITMIIDHTTIPNGIYQVFYSDMKKTYIITKDPIHVLKNPVPVIDDLLINNPHDITTIYNLDRTNHQIMFKCSYDKQQYCSISLTKTDILLENNQDIYTMKIKIEIIK